VDSARPAHNLEVADRLLREALASAVSAYHAAGLMPPAEPRLGPPATRGSCISCHYGVEEVSAELDPAARPVTHAQHMFRAPQPCEACHAAGAAPPGISDSLWIDTTRAPRRRTR
jgi:hypothetical protein